MHLAGLTHQQPLVLLGHVTDVIPEQGDPLELAQVLEALMRPWLIESDALAGSQANSTLELLYGLNHEFQQSLTDDEYQYPAEDGEKEL